MGSSLADIAVRALERQPPPDHPRPPHSSRATSLRAGELLAITDRGWEICGLATGASVFHIGVTGWPRGNTEVTALSSTMYAAREKALAGLHDTAARAGAEGVLDLDLDIHFMKDRRHLPRFVAVGTAVRRSARSPNELANEASGLFTTTVTALEFAQLMDAGYHPRGIVMGTCVYHVGRRAFSQWVATQRQNVEMTSYTEALYEARELAMSRLQTEALRCGADGVVGVTTTERSHVWRSHAIEFFALGTAVRDQSTTGMTASPQMAVPLNDAFTAADPGAIMGTTGDES